MGDGDGYIPWVEFCTSSHPHNRVGTDTAVGEVTIPPTLHQHTPEKSSISVTTMETVPLVGTPFSRLRMSMMFWRTCGRPARRRKKNLQRVVWADTGSGSENSVLRM